MPKLTRTAMLAALAASVLAAEVHGQNPNPAATTTRPGPAEAKPKADDSPSAWDRDLFVRLVEQAPDQNLVASPAGVASALAMVLPGARGETAQQLAKALHLAPGADPTALALDRLGREADRPSPSDLLGVRLNPAPGGLQVVAVVPSRPGARLGLAAGDVIQALNDQPVASVEDFDRIVQDTGGTARARVASQRTGKVAELALSVPVGPLVRSASSAWVQKDLAIQPDYLQTIRKGFGATLEAADFRADAGAAIQAINAWAAQQTGGRIDQIVDATSIDADTRLALLNAILFKGQWLNPFPKTATAPQPFQAPGGRRVEVPTMRQTRSYRYASTDAYQVVEIPYARGPYAMTILLPRQVEALPGADLFDVDLGTLQGRQVDLSLPRFRFDASFELRDALEALGVKTAFTDEADLSGISQSEGLKISDVVHKAFIAVDEEGTEAAAVTAVTAGVKFALPPEGEPVVVKVDHPFAFLIRDFTTGRVLFVGRVLDPATAPADVPKPVTP